VTEPREGRSVAQVNAQPVLTPLTEAAIFLVVTVRDGAEDDVRDALPDVSALVRAVGFRDRDGELSCVVGIGSGLWDRSFGGPRPADLHPFHEIVGARHTAVATAGDLLFHIRSRRMDLCFELAAQLVKRLGDAVDVVDETHGFKYFDERDLLGFVDGTENPTGPDAYSAAMIGDEDPDFTGGSYVIVQKYVHDVDAWNSMSVGEQERVIGRTKLDDIELADGVKPTNSHVALNTIVDDDGTERQIVRDNMPFGAVGRGEFGTYFIGYAATPSVTEQMLENMFVGRPPGNYDRILDVSTPVTGNLFFVPSADMLDDPPPPAGSGVATRSGDLAATAASADGAPTPAAPDGAGAGTAAPDGAGAGSAAAGGAPAVAAVPDQSLRIGSLRRGHTS
jgi:putative iron-dependent peroxidase